MAEIIDLQAYRNKIAKHKRYHVDIFDNGKIHRVPSDLSVEEVLMIYREAWGEIYNRRLMAQKWELSPQTISCIKHGYSFSHITGQKSKKAEVAQERERRKRIVRATP